MSMETRRVCQNCGAALVPDTPEGLCPKCLLKMGLASQPATQAGANPGSADALPDPSWLAKCFPQLEILELLGQGGMGAVYKARQPALDRIVALKLLPARAAGDSGFAERFTREARALAKLNHPNIVAVYDFGEVRLPRPTQSSNQPSAPSSHFFLMEYVDGLNLRQLEQAGKLTPRQALKIIPQICEALQYAHDEGVVHRDIKPENVLLDKKGRVKIADFGLAKIIGLEPQNMRLTGARDVMGTPHYMAPEQVEHPQEVDHRADIYSLGVVFYEMLTGELPLGKFAPPSSRTHGVQIDVRLDEVVLRALEKQPERRYQQASQVKTDVETIASTRPQPARANAGPSAPAPAATITGRQRPEFWKIAVGALAATLTVMLLISLAMVVFSMVAPWLHRPARQTLPSAARAMNANDSPMVVPPVVIKTVPESGATGIDPALGEIRATFSKPMQTNSWAWGIWNKENFPKATTPIHFLSDGRTCIFPVKLEPGTVYALWLNSETLDNFRDRQNQAAVPYLLIFETRK